jgi:hypothetical protein
MEGFTMRRSGVSRAEIRRRRRKSHTDLRRSAYMANEDNDSDYSKQLKAVEAG